MYFSAKLAKKYRITEIIYDFFCLCTEIEVTL